MKKTNKRKKIKYSKWKSFLLFLKGSGKAPSGLVIAFGKRGSGKSSNIAKDYLYWLKKGYKTYDKFYANMEFNIKNENCYYLDLSQYKFTDYIVQNDLTKKYSAFTDPTERGLIDTPFKIEGNCIIELDELGIIAHSRNYKDFPKEFINLIKILRKMGILLKANSQNYDIDKTLRQGASELRLNKKIIWWCYSKLLVKNIVVKDSNNDNESAENQIVDEIRIAMLLEKDAREITFIPFYTDLYDSYG